MSVALKDDAKNVAPQTGLGALDDPFRIAAVRHAMHLIIPTVKNGKLGKSRIEVREMLEGVRLYLDVDDDGIGVKTVALSFTEANKLAEMLNTIRRRAVDRGEWSA